MCESQIKCRPAMLALVLSLIFVCAPSSAQITAGSQSYLLSIKAAPVCLNGDFPIRIKYGRQTFTALAHLSVEANGTISGAMDLQGTSLTVTGKQSVKTSLLIALTAAGGNSKLAFKGSFCEACGNVFSGTVKGKCSLFNGNATFEMDAGGAQALAAEVTLAMTNVNGSLKGTGTVGIAGQHIAVKASGKMASGQVSLKGKSFSASAKLIEDGDGFLGNVKYSTFGVKGTASKVNIVALLDQTVQFVPAAAGATLVLSSGDHVTIPPNALSSDSMATLSLLSGSPRKPPGALLCGVGPALRLTFETIEGASPANAFVHAPRGAVGDIQFSLNISDTTAPGIPGSAPIVQVSNAPANSSAAVSARGAFDALAKVATGSIDPQFVEILGDAKSAAIDFALAKIDSDAPKRTLGGKYFDGTQWVDYPVAGNPAGFDREKRTLLLVHGMASSVEDAWDSDCVSKIAHAGGYEQVIGFNYDWQQHLSDSGRQIAEFLNNKGITNIDIEAHSEGVPVSLAAAGNPLSSGTTIGNMVLKGGPIMGTPAADNLYCLLTALSMASHTLLTPGSTPTLDELAGKDFYGDLRSDSAALASIRDQFKANRSNTALTLVSGHNPNSSKDMKYLGAFLQLTGAFPTDPFDGIVGESSAQAAAWDFPKVNRLPGYDLSHTQLECNSIVVADVGRKVNRPVIEATPASLSFTANRGASANPSMSFLKIKNTGMSGSLLNYTITSNVPWIGLSGPIGALPGGEMDFYTVKITRTDMDSGTYTGIITIEDSGSTNIAQVVNVSLTINPMYLLTTQAQGTGTGTITAIPSGPSYAKGALVTVFASPNSDSQFSHWEGDASGTLTSASITMDSDKSVIAVFTLKTSPSFTLTLQTAGTGSGTISANPPGPVYAKGTVVTLTAAPAPDSQFVSWSGDASGTGSQVTVTMSRDKTVIATFNLKSAANFTLTLQKQGTGNGTVKASPSGPTYAPGTSVTITATPDSNSQFANWAGDGSGVTNPLTVTMDTDKTVIAVFVPKPPPGNWTMMFTVGSGGICTTSDNQLVSAPPGTYALHFASGANSCSFTATAAHSTDAITWTGALSFNIGGTGTSTAAPIPDPGTSSVTAGVTFH